jgi:hypothetical protein
MNQPGALKQPRLRSASRAASALPLTFEQVVLVQEERMAAEEAQAGRIVKHPCNCA